MKRSILLLIIAAISVHYSASASKAIEAEECLTSCTKEASCTPKNNEEIIEYTQDSRKIEPKAPEIEAENAYNLVDEEAKYE